MKTRIVTSTLIFSTILSTIPSKRVKHCLNRKRFGGEVVTRENQSYKTYNHQWNIRNSVFPLGFLVVESAKDVKKVVQCAVKLKANITALGGGHSHEKYSFGSENHWIVDLRRLHHIDIDEKERLVTVGAGQRLFNISVKLWENGKFGFSAGSCFSVGIAGITLGGGIGFSSRKYGLTLDTLKEMEVVTADGKIRKVNKRKNSDLFWALRGSGGGNFGIVTRFKFEIFSASNKIIIVMKQYSRSEFVSMFRRWQQWILSNIDNSVSAQFRANRNGVFIIVVINNYNYNESLRQLEITRNYFPNITDAEMKIDNYMEMLALTSAAYTWSDSFFYYRPKSFFVSKILREKEIKSLYESFKKYEFLSIVIEMFGGKVNEVKSWETAFVHRNTYYCFTIGGSVVVGNITVEEARKIGKQNVETVNFVLNEVKFMDSGETYQNYVDKDLFDYRLRYYGSNYRRLQDVKRRWDPHDFFRFRQSITL